MVVILQKAKENEEGVKSKWELVTDENSSTQCFGLQMQFQVTSIGDERNTLYFEETFWKMFLLREMLRERYNT